jgi:hypothetical protein
VFFAASVASISSIFATPTRNFIARLFFLAD